MPPDRGKGASAGASACASQPVPGSTAAADGDLHQQIERLTRQRDEARAEVEQLKDSSRFLESILEHIPDMIFVKDAEELRFVRFNSAGERLLGYTREDLIGKNDHDFFPTEEADAFTSKDRQVLEGGVLSDIAEEPIHTTRGTRWLHTKKIPIVDDAGTPRYLLGISEDITAQKEAEATLRLLRAQKHESMTLLAGGIAHDFNNLLGIVLGNASIALMRLSTDSPVKEVVERIVVSAERASDLTRQLLAYSGKGSFTIEPISVSETVEEIAGLLKVTMSKNATLVFELEPSLPPVEADVAQLRQLVMNFITNASDALGSDVGTITLATRHVQADRSYLDRFELGGGLEPGSFVELEVRDTGCGMAQATVQQIFDPFFTTKQSGHGLGLAAGLGIVRGHGGAIRVSSEAGEGTTFQVLLPAHVGANDDPSAPRLAVAEPVTGGTILVVDDEDALRTVASDVLRMAGFDVVTACDGVEALERFRERDDIVAVLLDMAMPRMNGAETFRELRRLRADVPVLLSSGYDEQQATSQFAGEGLAGFLQKPYRATQLIERIQDLVRATRGE